MWDSDLIAFVSGDAGDGVASAELKRKLGAVETDGSASAGKVGSWWVDRFGLNSGENTSSTLPLRARTDSALRTDCIISHFTGDNPATLLSYSLLSGDIILSLGTSDTVLLSTTNYAPSPDSHVFAYPANYPNAAGKRSYMAMLCYKKCAFLLPFAPSVPLLTFYFGSGSLPREKVRDEYAGGSWEEFDRLVREFPPPASAEEASTREIGFWFLKPEIIVLAQFFLCTLRATANFAFNSLTTRSGHTASTVKGKRSRSSRHVHPLESHFVILALTSSSPGPPLQPSCDPRKPVPQLPTPLCENARQSPSVRPLSSPGHLVLSADPPPLSRIFAVGGASLNPTILSALASVTGAPVFRPSSSSSTSCSIGGCFKAFWSYRRANGLGDVCFEDAVKAAQAGGKAGASAPVEGEKVCDPGVGDFEAYGGMVERFWRCEEKVYAA